MGDVPTGDERWRVERADALEFVAALPDDSVDLLFTSPPYEAARTYDVGFSLAGEAWVEWMVKLVRAVAPKVKGLIAVNCDGQTRGYSYSGVPFLLFADLKRAGFNMRKPCVYERDGIPGSGGPDWLKNRWEPVICVTRPGRLSWSDNKACGEPPKCEPGGHPSYRQSDGTRVPKERLSRKERGEARAVAVLEGRGKKMRVIDSGEHADKETRYEWNYVPPDIANPGNVLKFTVGGGHLGHPLAHENEAPFPVELPAFFIKSFCPPDGVTLDPFCGSGTTCQAAIENGRRFLGCDLRQSQVDLTRRRMETVTPSLPGLA